MTDTKNLYDAVIIGGGPAGLTAALYLGRARYRVLVLEKDRFGGQITITNEVVNYPGVLAASGEELAGTMRQQAANFGAEFKMAEVTGLEMDGDVKTVHTTKGDVQALSVLLASGASPRHVGFDGEEDYQGHGVAYCATCDGEFFTGKEVLVVGGGFAAAEESVFLTKYAKHVTILVRGDDFSCATSTAEPAKKHPKITVRYNTRIVRVSGDTGLRSAVLENTKTKKRETWRPEDEGETFGIFVLSGYVPATGLVADIAEVDERGYVVTDEHNMTTCEGLFAAGDVCQKPLRQVATAVGEAAAAATEMERFIQTAQEKTGLVPEVSAPTQPKEEHQGAKSVAGQRAAAGTLFDEAMLAQLNTVFSRMENPLVLKLSLNDLPVAETLRTYMEELAKLTDKLTVELVDDPQGDDLPKVEVFREDGSWTGLAYHGAPGGHEFTPFILGLYNASGPGQAVDEEDRAQIDAIDRPIDFKVIVGLTCTMCPELVTSVQRIATLSDKVTAQVYDVAHFPALQQRYDVMSVPCLVINDGERVEFGRKNVTQVLELLK
ncbi:MAG: FAD-dependent oxidoreductase [Coriobacteriales bacterium]|nr:FAD-dependent oxidoreductase [Coriobacteriaceae bacterium]MDY2722915.1 FAD-dependent oxidoreductase [Coriobacteriales bacterium]